ncbi:MAG: hypothetical protein CMM52_16535 [Rhodospirillaceae bacterium]|nr:hypothetical protein [Rhodospirillaceae bacterium]|tara:strand:- start:3038 stop:3835 length:798 start_codon:yes stop_codon:yes gene_type:complete
MAQNSRLSVTAIIPTHLRDELLKRAIQSVVDQDFPPLEIIVVDDTSSSDTRSIVKAFDKNSPMDVIYMERTNYKESSSPASINMAAESARGNVLAILDDDDYWAKNYLSTVIDQLDGEPADFVVTAMTYFNEKGETWNGKLLPDDYDKRDWLVRNPGMGCSNLVIRRDVFLDVGGFDGRLFVSGDRDLFMRLMKFGARLHINKNRQVLIQKFDIGLSRGKPWRMIKSNLRLYRKYALQMPIDLHYRNWVKFLGYTKAGLLSKTDD